MSIPLTVNGSVFNFPAVKEPSGTWAQNVISWAIQVSNSTLQLDGGAGLPGGVFALTGEVDFGTAEGLRAKSYKIRDTGSAFDITMQAPTLSASYSLTWPVDDGTSGQVLTTDGAGLLTWAASAGGASTFQALYTLDSAAAAFDLDAAGSFAVRDSSSNNILFVDEATDRVTVENLSIDASSFILDADEGSGFTGTFRLFGGSPLTAARTYDFPDASGTIAISPTFQNIYDFGAADSSFNLDASGFWRIKDFAGNNIISVNEATDSVRLADNGTDYMEFALNSTFSQLSTFGLPFLVNTGSVPGEIQVTGSTATQIIRSFGSGSTSIMQVKASGNSQAGILQVARNEAIFFRADFIDMNVGFGNGLTGPGHKVFIRGSANATGQAAEVIWEPDNVTPKTSLMSSVVDDSSSPQSLWRAQPLAGATFADPDSDFFEFFDGTNGVANVKQDGRIFSAKTLQRFSMGDVVLPTSSPAASVVRNDHQTIAFDDTTNENVVFEGVMHKEYSTRDITVDIEWAAATATSGDVVWDVAFERGDADSLDIDSDSFAAVQSATDTAAAASGQISVASITFTQAQADAIAAGEPYRIRVTRNAASGSDTMSGDAQLLRVHIKE